MTSDDSAAGLSTAELLRIDRAEALAYEDLFAAAAASLGTGSERIGDATAIWYPEQREAGYNCIVNFHLVTDKDVVYEQARERIARADSKVFGIPIDHRVRDWATPERIKRLGLTYESCEHIWSRRLDPDQLLSKPAIPDGITLAECNLDEGELGRLINCGWELDEGDARGRIFSFVRSTPNWHVYLAKCEGDIAAISVLCCYLDVAILMLSVVMPPFRGRGLQSYFIAERLSEGAARGCTLAMAETDDDNASPRNMQRAGFSLSVRRDVYSRPI